MGMTSAAEAKLDARIRPEITALRAHTSYPKRRRSFGAAEPGVDADRDRAGSGPADDTLANDANDANDALASNVAELVREAKQARPGGQAGSKRTAAPTTPGPIRLTRRGRIVVGALVGLVAAAGASLLWLLVASQAHASSQLQAGRAGGHALIRVVVRPGQTLWSIASTSDPAADPRVVIQEIVDENSLAGTSIRPGQVLLVPRG